MGSFPRSMGRRSGDRNAEAGEERVEAIEPFVHALRHPALDHRVPRLERLVDRVRPDGRPAIVLLEAEPVEGDVARGALELERLDHAVGRGLAMEDSMEPVLVAVGVAMEIAPGAA